MPIATVIALIGQAWARDADGNLRELSVGDILLEGETLVTADNARVELDFGDNIAPTVIEGAQQIVMTPDLAAGQDVAAEDFSGLDEDLEALLAALDDDDVDLLDIFDATAAGAGGAGGGGGGSDFVQLGRITETTGSQTYDYGLNAFGGPPETPEGGVPVEPAVEEAVVEEIDEVDGQPTIAISISGDTLVLRTGDSDTISGGTGTDSTSFQVGFQIDSSDFGSDGPGSISWQYTLGLASGVSSGVDSGLTSGGATIYLHDIGGTIIGSTESVSGVVGPINTVFTIEVDGSGVVTLTQSQPINHDVSSSGDFANDIQQLADGLVVLTGTATITDSDGDTASDSATLDLGGNIVFEDDGPSIDLNEVELPTITVDEAGLVDNESVSNSTPVDFSGLFTINAGADGQASATYSLVVGLDNEDQPIGSGVKDVASGQTVQLRLAEDSTTEIEGYVTIDEVDELVFTVSVNSDGEITLTQYRAMEHDGDDLVGEDDPLQLTAGSIHLTLDVVDNDGDSATQSIAIGGALEFLDDGPSIDLNEVELPTITVDEAGLVDNESVSNSTPVDFSGLFTINAGADGQASATYSLVVGLDNEDQPIGSGVKDVASGQTVQLRLAEDSTTEIEGYVTIDEVDELVFTVSVNSDGEITLTQYRAMEHDGDDLVGEDDPLQLTAGSIHLTLDVVDNDGDSATQSIAIGGALEFLDDGPSIDLNEVELPTITVDEAGLVDNESVSNSTPVDFSGLFTINAGADGQASATYSLVVGLDNEDQPIGSGVKDVASGQTVQLRLAEDSTTEIEGYVTIDEVDELVFTVSVNSDGEITLTQYRAMEHDGDDLVGEDDPLQLTAGSIHLTLDVVDNDGDSATQSIAIGGALEFLDDGPNIGPVRSAFMTHEVGGSLTDDLPVAFGADGEGSIKLFGSNSGGYWTYSAVSETRLTSNGEDLLYRENADGSLDAYYLDDDDNEVNVFQVTVNADQGTYTFTQNGPINGVANDVTEVGFSSGFGGGNKGDAFFSSSENVGDEGSVIVKASPGDSSDTVNYNNNGLGISQGSTIDDPSELLVLEFFQGDGWSLTGNGVNKVLTEPVGDAAALSMNSLTLSFWGLDGNKGEVPTFEAFDEDGNSVTITSQQNIDGTWTLSSDNDFTTIHVSAQDGSGNGFGVSSALISNTIEGDSATIGLGATVTDADGDTSSVEWNFTSVPNGQLVEGTEGDEVLQGSEGRDSIYGGAGDDVLLGGAGADTFVWNFGEGGGDQGSTEEVAIDTVIDFDLNKDEEEGQSDVLRFNDLLQGSDTVEDDVNSYIFAEQDGNNTVLHVSTAGNIGADGENADQKVVLNNVSMGDANSSDFIKSLIDEGKLDIE